jgi:hypothetical protein
VCRPPDILDVGWYHGDRGHAKKGLATPDTVGKSMGTKLNSLAQQAAKTRLFSRLEQPLGWFEDLHFRRTFASSPFSTNPSRT